MLISDNELRTLPLVMYTFFTAYERPWDLAMASLTMVLTPAIIMFVILQNRSQEELYPALSRDSTHVTGVGTGP